MKWLKVRTSAGLQELYPIKLVCTYKRFFLFTGDEVISVNPPKEPGAPTISQGNIHILHNYF